MTQEQRVVLRCKVFNRPVEVCLLRCEFQGPTQPGLPEGWKVKECLEKDTDCYGRDCPFTMDGGNWPFEAWG